MRALEYMRFTLQTGKRTELPELAAFNKHLTMRNFRHIRWFFQDPFRSTASLNFRERKILIPITGYAIRSLVDIKLHIVDIYEIAVCQS